ncbi:MAG: ABC transporter permease [Desulfuromonadaceae bacterium]|nr:ABC transporter permease [Desulfuromonadaceae bacterium]
MLQNPLLCVAAVGTMAVSLTIVAFFGVIFFNFEELTTSWSRRIQIKTYLEKIPSDEVLKEWRKQVEGYPEVADVVYVSQQEAFERFRQRLGQNSDLLQGMNPSILPASLEIGLKEGFRNSQGVEAVVTKLKQNPHFSDMRFGREWLERFDSFVLLLKFSAAILGGFLLFATVFIVANTIKLTLYARREELEVMSLVGGTPAFIKMPYIIEGAAQGLFGGLLALGASYLIFALFLKQSVVSLLLTMGVGHVSFLPPRFQLGLLGAGVALGILGSMTSLRKFVRIRYQ